MPRRRRYFLSKADNRELAQPEVGLATRYNKLALIFRGAAVLRSILIWLDA